MSKNILYSSIIRLHCTDLSINIMNTSARKHCYQGGVVDWRILSAKYIYVLIMKWKSTERLLPRWSGRCKWQPWPAMPPKKHRNEQNIYVLRTPSIWRFIIAKITHENLHIPQQPPPIPNESFSPATVAWQSSDQQGSPPSSSQLASSLEPNQNFLTILKLLNWDLENSTCSNHSSLSSMPGLFGPSSTILLLFASFYPSDVNVLAFANEVTGFISIIQPARAARGPEGPACWER